ERQLDGDRRLVEAEVGQVWGQLVERLLHLGVGERREDALHHRVVGGRLGGPDEPPALVVLPELELAVRIGEDHAGDGVLVDAEQLRLLPLARGLGELVDVEVGAGRGVIPRSRSLASTATATLSGPLRSSGSSAAVGFWLNTWSTFVSAQLDALVFTSAVAVSPFLPAESGSTVRVCG